MKWQLLAAEERCSYKRRKGDITAPVLTLIYLWKLVQSEKKLSSSSGQLKVLPVCLGGNLVLGVRALRQVSELLCNTQPFLKVIS